MWWEWDARLTMALLLWMIFVVLSAAAAYGGPGSEKLAAGLALFGMANVAVRLSVGEHLADDPSADDGRADAAGRFRVCRCGTAFAGFLLLYIALMMLRMDIERQRAMLDQLYLESEE